MLMTHFSWRTRIFGPAILGLIAALIAPSAFSTVAVGQDDYDAGYDDEYDDTEWWENSASYNEDEAYDPTDWFDGNNYEYDYDYYDGGYDDDDYDNDWTYDYYDYGYGDNYGYYGNDGNELGLFD